MKETKTPYRATRKSRAVKSPSSSVTLRWADVEQATEPIVLERNGQPVAVVLKYEDYRHWKSAQAENRQQAWQELEDLLERVHARTQAFSTEEVEADITAARQEVREQHQAARQQN